jgi:hypothetical protein
MGLFWKKQNEKDNHGTKWGESMVKCITKNTCHSTSQVNKKYDQNPSQNYYTFNLFS